MAGRKDLKDLDMTKKATVTMRIDPYLLRYFTTIAEKSRTARMEKAMRRGEYLFNVLANRVVGYFVLDEEAKRRYETRAEELIPPATFVDGNRIPPNEEAWYLWLLDAVNEKIERDNPGKGMNEKVDRITADSQRLFFVASDMLGEELADPEGRYTREQLESLGLTKARIDRLLGESGS